MHQSQILNIANMSFTIISGNNILAKISEFTVLISKRPNFTKSLAILSGRGLSNILFSLNTLSASTRHL